MRIDTLACGADNRSKVAIDEAGNVWVVLGFARYLSIVIVSGKTGKELHRFQWVDQTKTSKPIPLYIKVNNNIIFVLVLSLEGRRSGRSREGKGREEQGNTWDGKGWERKGTSFSRT